MKPMPKLNMDSIEWRAEGKPFKRGNTHQCLWVTYLKAATVAAIFDEWVGPENWTDTYTVREFSPKGTDVVQALECTIAVNVGDGQWVTKSDIGEFTNFSAVKGGYSDAFKRCATLKWGVGRVVYELPQVWAECRVYGPDNAPKIGGETRDTANSIKKQLVAAGFDGVSHRVSAEVFEGDDEHNEAGADVPTGRKAEVKSSGDPVAQAEVQSLLMQAWNELGAGKNMAMKELKGNDLWPLGSLEGDYGKEALRIIGRIAEAEAVASS